MIFQKKSTIGPINNLTTEDGGALTTARATLLVI
jgi:hypothetical protein